MGDQRMVEIPNTGTLLYSYFENVNNALPDMQTVFLTRHTVLCKQQAVVEPEFVQIHVAALLIQF
jgi:hypothetical protein